MDDAMTPLEATLDDIVGKLRENRFPNEQSISQGVVLRVLGDLNWDVYDPAVVWPEYSTGGGRVDFALCYPPRKPRIFVEVKQPGGAGRGVKQALEYAFHTGVPFIALTDGATWSFYLPAEQGSYEERRVFMLDLLESPADESADTLRRYIEQSRVVSGDALRVAREEYQRRSRRAAARLDIPKAWNGLIDKRDKSLTSLLADAVEARAGFRPADADIVDFLASLRQRTSVISPPPPLPSEEPEDPRGKAAWWAGRIIRSTRTENPRQIGSQGWVAHKFIMDHADGVTYEDYRAAGYTLNHLKWDLDHGYITAERKDEPVTETGYVRPLPRGTLRILGDEIEYASPMNAVEIILKKLQKEDPNFLSNFYRHPRNKGRSRSYVAKSTEELYENTPYLRNSHKPLGDGWLMATYIGKPQQKIILEIAAAVAGLTLGRDIVVNF